jgi:hypothetical protein
VNNFHWSHQAAHLLGVAMYLSLAFQDGLAGAPPTDGPADAGRQRKRCYAGFMLASLLVAAPLNPFRLP